MTKNFIVACIQTQVSDDTNANIETALRYGIEAAKQGAQLVCFAEYFTGLANQDGSLDPIPFFEHEHPALPRFKSFAQKHGLYVLLGSLGIRLTSGDVVNRSYVLDDQGKIICHYDKIHLFDVDIDQNSRYRESDILSPGTEAVVASTPWGGLGLSICYDLRFAHLYRSLAKHGASFLAIPAAFTKKTGEVHWHILNRARAIEHGAFIFSPCSQGPVVGGGECYGHSLIIDPWGEILAEGPADSDSVVLAEIETERVSAARAKIPSLLHDRQYSAPT